MVPARRNSDSASANPTLALILLLPGGKFNLWKPMPAPDFVGDSLTVRNRGCGKHLWTIGMRVG